MYRLSMSTNKIAYKESVLKINPNEQYINGEDHFLIIRPEYLLMAKAFGLDFYIPDKISKNEELVPDLLIDRLCETVIEMHQNVESQKETLLLAGGQGNISFIINNLTLVYLAHNFPHIRGLPVAEINKSLIEADWAEKFRYR